MSDITEINTHAQTPENASSTPSVDSGEISSVADKLYSWLGSFWSTVYEDPDFVRYVQGARALRIAQLYLDILESAKLLDRSEAPVFHRERWYPIVLRKSGRNTGSDTMLKLGSAEKAVLGDQNPGSEEDNIFPPGTYYKIGGKEVSFKNMVVYEIDKSINKIATCIVDNIAEPKVFLHPNTDFAVIDGTLALREDCDPFSEESKFPVFDVEGEDPANPDQEVVLWACDTFVDKDYVYGHLGYVIGLPTGSSDNYKRIVNSVWNSISDGATPKLLQALIAAICDVPTIKNENETVETVLLLDDDPDSIRYQIITDKEVYTLPKYAVPHPNVHAGTVLHRFDLLDDSIRVYPYVTDVDRISGYTEFADKFESDVPAIDLPPALFRVSLEDGFSVGWDERDIVFHGYDSNGNPKLSFRIDGSDSDNDAFWEDIWSTYEETKTSMEPCFGDSICDKVYSEGKTCGKIVPIKFFLRQLIGANTLVITVKTDVIGDNAPLYDPKFFQTVRECIPSYVRMFFIEHESVGLDGGDEEESDLSRTEEEWEENAYEESFDDARLNAKRGFRSRDETHAKWIANCKDSYDDID